MKKILPFISLLVLPLFGCASGESGDGLTHISLTTSNYTSYLSVTKYDGDIPNEQDSYISFRGVLSFAIYENVSVGLHIHFVYAYDSSKTFDADRTIQLNAAGEGSSVLYYVDGTIDHVVDTKIGPGSLWAYHFNWFVKSISGTVTYRL